MWLRVDVYIRESCVVVEAELPGIALRDLRLRATPRTLRIQAPACESATRRWREYHRRERSRGRLDREIPLPAPVDPDAGEARLGDGLLEVRLPLRRPRGAHRDADRA